MMVDVALYKSEANSSISSSAFSSAEIKNSAAAVGVFTLV